MELTPFNIFRCQDFAKMRGILDGPNGIEVRDLKHWLGQYFIIDTEQLTRGLFQLVNFTNTYLYLLDIKYDELYCLRYDSVFCSFLVGDEQNASMFLLSQLQGE